jgi:hypothetical protein
MNPNLRDLAKETKNPDIEGEFTLYEGDFRNWKGYGNGVIIQDKDVLTAYREDGRKIELYKGGFEHWLGYGNGAIVENRNVLTAIREDKTKWSLSDQFSYTSSNCTPYGHGVIIREGDVFIAHTDDGSLTRLCEEDCVIWYGYGGGVIIGIGNGLTACKGNGVKIRLFDRFDPRVQTWNPYGHGIIIEEEDVFRAYSEDGRSRELYRGDCENWIGYGNGLIIQKGNKLIAYRAKDDENY